MKDENKVQDAPAKITMEYTTIKGEKALNAAINTVIKSATDTRDAIQNILVNAEIHYLETGDYTIINRLIQSLDEVKGFRGQGLTVHAMRFCELEARDSKDKHGRTKKADGFNHNNGIHKGAKGKNALTDEERAERIEEMKATYWYSLAPGANRSSFDNLNLEQLAMQFYNTLVRQEEKALNSIPKNLEGEDRVVWLKNHTTPVSPAMLEKVLRKLDINKILDDAIIEEEEVIEVPENVDAPEIKEIAGRTDA